VANEGHKLLTMHLPATSAISVHAASSSAYY